LQTDKIKECAFCFLNARGGLLSAQNHSGYKGPCLVISTGPSSIASTSRHPDAFIIGNLDLFFFRLGR
jgi:hypothetical protein